MTAILTMAEDASKNRKYVPMMIEKSQVPKGAIRLTKNDILKIQHARLKRCKSSSEIYAFQFAPHILGGSSALTSIAVNTHFRMKFQLFNVGLMFSYAPTVIIPTVLCLTANEYLSREVLLEPNCKECLQVRSGILQVATSAVYSCILAPVTSIILSKKYLTFANPKRRFEPTFRYAFKTNASTCSQFAILMAVNFALGAFVRYKQQIQLDHIIEKEPVSVSRELLEAITD